MTSVQAVMLSRDQLQSVSPEDSALDLLERMRRTNTDQMAVVKDDNVVGIVTLDSILRVVQTRNELGHVTGQ